MSKNITVEVEVEIMSEIAKLTEGKKDSALAHVSESGRFAKMMEDCRTDELGVRVQRQVDIANKVAQKSLSLIIKKLAVKHCQDAIKEVNRVKQMNMQLIQENKQLRKAVSDPVAAARRQIQKEVKHKSNNELRRRDMARKRTLEAGLIQDTAESPLKRAMGGVWLEATRNSKAVGGRGSKDRQLAVWKEETRNILKKIAFTADQGSLLKDVRNTDASSNS